MNHNKMTENIIQSTEPTSPTMEQVFEKSVFELHGKGFSERAIANELKCKRYDVRSVLKTIDSTKTKTLSIDSTTGSTKTTITTKPINQVVDVDKPPEKPLEEVPPELNRELWMKATPILRKVTLNPKFGLYYDYVREKLGFDGDEGDFIMDCIDYYYAQCLHKKVMMVTVDEVK